MKVSFLSFALFAALLTSCTTSDHTSDTLIEYELAEHRRTQARDAYRMRDLIYALDSVWEMSPAGRRMYVDEHYPSGVPEDFVTLPESGAQCALTAMRLDTDLLAVVCTSQLVDGYSDVHVLRRIPGGWADLTKQAFPFRFTPDTRIEARRDRSILVRRATDKAFQRYAWNGSRFIRS